MGGSFGRCRSFCLGLILSLLLPLSAVAEGLRFATWDVGLARKGPGLLLRDISKGADPQVAAVRRGIEALDADVLLLTDVDFDAGTLAARALAGDLYPHIFSLRPNTGMATGLDLDGDGRTGGAGDAQGWGRFSGHQGMVLLSRLPLGEPRDFSGFLWRDLPGADLPPMSDAARAVQRLSTTGHWEVPVLVPGGGSLRLLLWSATAPVFDGPEDRNGRRGGDEALFWSHLLDGKLPMPPPEPPFLLMGKANIDPRAGDGRRAAMATLLSHPALRDPLADGPATAVFRGAPGRLRLDYVLPSQGLTATGAGVLWPPDGDPLAAMLAAASAHRPVWVEVVPP